MEKAYKMGIYASQFIDVWKDKLVLVSYLTNRIYLIDPEEHYIVDEMAIKGAGDEAMQYRAFGCFDDGVVLTPYNANSFVYVDFVSGRQCFIGEDHTENYKDKKEKYYRIIKSEKSAYIIGEGVKEVLEIDLGTEKKIHPIFDYSDKENICWTSTYAMDEKNIYIPSRTEDAILCINTKTSEVTINHVIGSISKSGFWDIYEDGGKMHLFDEIGNEFIWNPKDRWVELSVKNDAEPKITSRQCIKYKDKIYRIALRQDEVYCRENGGIFEAIGFPIKQNEIRGAYSRFQEGARCGKYYYFQNRRGQIIQLNMETKGINDIWIKPTEKQRRYRKDYFSKLVKNTLIYEGEEFTLEEYADFLL